MDRGLPQRGHATPERNREYRLIKTAQPGKGQEKEYKKGRQLPKTFRTGCYRCEFTES